jgi:hypothetical protein
MQRTGHVIYWSTKSAKGGFGFLSSRSPQNAAIVQKFFFHESNIKICQPEKIESGCPVLFDESPRPPKLGDAPFAINISVLNKPTPVSAAVSDALAGMASAGKDEVE